MKRPFRTAIIGMGGFAASHHAAVLQLESTGDSRLVCTCDPAIVAFDEQQRLLNFRDRAVRVYDRYDDMLDHHALELDLLVVPTPVYLHAEMHRAGVKRQIPVFLEKPPTLDYQELLRMIAIEETASASTLVGFNYIIEPERLALKRRLIRGEFGRIREGHLQAQWSRAASYFERNNWAGRLRVAGKLVLDSCLGNALGHFVHNMLFWSGEAELWHWGEVASVRAELYRTHAIEGADTAFVECVTQSGVLLRFALTHAGEAARTHRETIICERAIVHYCSGSHAEVQWADGRREKIVLQPFNALRENHLAYHNYLSGHSHRPATRLVDSLPMVAINTLAYVSSGEITTLPSRSNAVGSDAGVPGSLTIPGTTDRIEEFQAHGVWPSTAGWARQLPSKLTHPQDVVGIDKAVDSMIHDRARRS